MSHLFFYWRVAAPDAAAALQALASWHAGMAERWPMVTSKRYVRHEPSRCTLMETYELESGPASECEAWLIAQGQLVSQPWRVGERRLERFDEHRE